MTPSVSIQFPTTHLYTDFRATTTQVRFVYSVKKVKIKGVTKDLHYVLNDDYHLYIYYPLITVQRRSYLCIITRKKESESEHGKKRQDSIHMLYFFLTWKDTGCAFQAACPPVICISCTFHEFDLVILSERQIARRLSIIIVEGQHISFWFDK